MKLSRIIPLLVAVGGLVLSASATDQPAPTEPPAVKKTYKITLQRQFVAPEINCIKNRGYLVVAIADECYPPLIYRDAQGELAGINVNLVKAIGRFLNVEIKYNLSGRTAEEIINIVNQGKADIGIDRIHVEGKYAGQVLFSQGYAEIGHTFLINRVKLASHKNASKESLQSLLNRKESSIGVIEGEIDLQALKERLPQAQFKSFKTWEEIASKVLSQELTAGFKDDLTVRQVFQDYNDAPLKVMAVRLKNEKDVLKIITSWTSSNLLSWINNFLSTHRYYYTADDLLKILTTLNLPHPACPGKEHKNLESIESTCH